MGPYCNCCGNRCFVSTKNDDYIKTDLKATCKNGMINDLNKTYPKIVDKNYDTKYWLLELDRLSEYSRALEILNGQIMEFEIKNTELEEIINLSNKEIYEKTGPGLFYRLKG